MIKLKTPILTLQNSFVLLIVSVLIFACSEKKPQRLYGIYDGKAWGYIDTAGKVIIPPNLSLAGAFQEGLAIVIDTSTYNTYCFINQNVDTVINSSEYALTRHPINMYPYHRTRINDKDFDDLSFARDEFSFSSGLALIYDIKTRLFGYINKKGEVVIKPQYTNATKFFRGYAVIQTSFDSTNWENFHVGLIDSLGKLVIPDKYYNLTRLSNNYLIGTLATKQGEAYGFTSLLLNKKGEVINTLLPGYMCLFNEFSGGYAAVWNGVMATIYKTPYCIIDSTGNVFKNKENGQDLYFEDLIINRGKYFWCKRNGKYVWFTINNKSNIVVVDNKFYDTVKSGFNIEGIACVRYANSNGNSRYGYIDTLGNFLITPRYHYANDFRGPLAGAQLKSGNILIDGYINKKGTFVWSKEIRDKD
ncbi:MAG: WG repeat-containing protein [Opitutaceae bacterium]|nr:WG repeat-containing protein [Cytophagales bacterium]